MLKKHTGKTKDNLGCEFSYTCYKSIDIFGDAEDCIFVCKEFPAIKAGTLTKLKELVSNV